MIVLLSTYSKMLKVKDNLIHTLIERHDSLLRDLDSARRDIEYRKNELIQLQKPVIDANNDARLSNQERLIAVARYEASVEMAKILKKGSV